MRNNFKVVIVLTFFYFLIASVADATDRELNNFVNNLNVQAEADLGAFRVKLSSHFGVPMSQVNVLLKTVDRPADAYMCLRVAQLSNQPTEVVVKEYKANKGRGWGVIAKNLGIKPGSKEFHELKSGDLSSGPGGGRGKGGGKGKGKWHNK